MSFQLLLLESRQHSRYVGTSVPQAGVSPKKADKRLTGHEEFSFMV